MLWPIKECREWDQEVYERIGRDLTLNGREIKNLIKTSLAIAITNKTVLTEGDLRLVYSFNRKSVQHWEKAVLVEQNSL